MTAISQTLDFVPVRTANLPIFRGDRENYSLFYTPGYLCLVHPRWADQFGNMLALGHSECASSIGCAALELREKAATVLASGREASPFQPECLTLYLHNRCNLRCPYCFAASSPHRRERLNNETIRAGARYVANSCARKRCTFAVGLHGGGEPTLDHQAAREAMAIVRRAAAEAAVTTYHYIATNGVMNERTAIWMAGNFDLVGLSCDGPPDIQNCMRPRWNGEDTSNHVERTAQIIRKEGGRLQVRATITSQNVRRQTEMVAYFREQLTAEALHYEPVYQGGRADTRSETTNLSVEEFVENFLAARRLAQFYGLPLHFAGVRLNERHGPYCHIFRNVVNLVPGNVVTACFKCSDMRQARRKGTIIGNFDPNTGLLNLHEDRISALRAILGNTLGRCSSCFNHYHCAGSCPEVCRLEKAPFSDFRCQVQKRIAAVLLEEEADRLWQESISPREGRAGALSGRTMEAHESAAKQESPVSVQRNEFAEGTVYAKSIC